MGNQHASESEKLNIVIKFFNSGLMQRDFCEIHDINTRTLQRWIKQYREQGPESFKAKEDLIASKASESFRTEQELRDEILRLRIENERLKKNYTVQKSEDGKTEFIRLRAKSSKS